MTRDKVAIVTGGTKGIGKAIVGMLLSRNYKVYTNFSKDDKAAVGLLDEFKKYKDRLIVLKADQSNINEFNSFITKIRNSEQYIDCIVCNSGATLRKSLTDITNNEWENVLNVSLNSHFYLIRDLYSSIPYGSRIVFIGSMMGIYPHSISIAYGVAKASLHSLALNLIKVFENTGTTVNVIAPGFVETEWQKNKPEDIRKNIYNKTACGRFANVKEVVAGVEFCLDNEFVNGSILEMSGGYNYK